MPRSAYFKAPRERPKMPEIVEIYREQNIAFCLFTVDCESGLGAKRVSNYEIADFAAQHADICIPFASIDPHKGKLGAREARDLVENHGVRGFKFHHILQAIDPGDRVGMADLRSDCRAPACRRSSTPAIRAWAAACAAAAGCG